MPWRHAVANSHCRNFGKLVGLGKSSLCLLRRLLHFGSRRTVTRTDDAEILFYLCEDLSGLDITHNRQNRIVGSVILLVERLDICDFSGIEVFELPVEIMRIGVGVKCLARKINRKEEPIRTI